MKRRKTMIGICALCALALSAFAAQGASAQTAFTCAPVSEKTLGTKGFKDAHCKEAAENTVATPEVVKFEHKEFTGPTKVTLTNITTGTARSTAKLRTVQSGVILEVQATEVEGTGTLENVEEGGVMFAAGNGILTLRNAKVTVPAGKGCEVVGGRVVTNELSTTNKGLSNELKIGPKSGETDAEVTISGCSLVALNHTYTINGTVTGKSEGATVVFTHTATTAQHTLSMGGQSVGIEYSVTIKGENGNGLALT